MANDDYGVLFDIEPAPGSKTVAAKKSLVKRLAKVPKMKAERGCAFCPQNNMEGINKVKGLSRIKGRKIMVWAQNPGALENEKGLELIGRAGQLLWKDAAAVGLTREMCDIQNVVRCRTPKEEKFKDFETGEIDTRIVDGEPSKEIAHCCSIYSEEALRLNGGKALVHLVFGQFAAKTLLGSEFRKDGKVFWSKNLNAWVICTYHPSYFNRGGSASRREQFRAALKAAKEIAEGKNSRFAFVESQDYKEIHPKFLNDFYTELCKVAKAGIRIVPDLEWGNTKPDGSGKTVLVMAGFCWKPGVSRCVFYDHPEVDKKYKPVVLKFLKAVFENKDIKKSLHHGSSDTKSLWELLKVKILGYDFDTNYSEYLAYSDRKAYGLAAIAEARFPKFSGYKEMLEPYYLDKKLKTWSPYLTPKDLLVKYNGADCDLSKRIELTTKKKVNPSLMRVFVHCGFVMDEMQDNGPLFDARYYQILMKWIPKRLEIVTEKLRAITKNPKFNFNAPKQVYDFLYEKMHLDKYLPNDWIEEHGLNTQKETMDLLSNFHPAPSLIAEGRRYKKLHSTYMEGFRRSNEIFGRIRTNWWLTGTVTGRLRSGGSKKEVQHEKGIVNLQNIDGSPEIESMLISDQIWWAIYTDWKNGMSPDELVEKYGDSDVFLGFDQSQLEMRVLAQMSGDPGLIKASNTKYDIHSSVGHLLTGIDVERIKKDRDTRTMIKGFHFGIVFGLQKEQLYLHILGQCKQLGMKPPSKDELFANYDKYFSIFKQVKPFQNSCVEFAENNGYVETLFGFRREVAPGDMGRTSFWKNQAMNSPIQGTAHQLMLIAMAIMRMAQERYWAIRRLCMEIHDATYSFTKLKDLAEGMKQGKKLLTQDVLVGVKKWWPELDWKVGLQVEGKAGYRLGVMVGEDEWTTSQEFIQKWCEKNQKTNLGLQAKAKKDLQIAS